VARPAESQQHLRSGRDCGATAPPGGHSGSQRQYEDTRPHKVVRNDKWEFSIWLDYKELPTGWYAVGFAGTQHACLEFIEQNCVFGAPNPGMSAGH
jgi:MbtH protein